MAHVVRMRLSQEVETFFRLGRATRAVPISSIIKFSLEKIKTDLNYKMQLKRSVIRNIYNSTYYSNETLLQNPAVLRG